MADLEIDGDALRATELAARQIAAALGAAGADASATAHAVGHERLARAVRRFADAWRDDRERTLQEVEALADRCEAVRRAFDDADDAIAGAAIAGTATAARSVLVPKPARSSP